MKVRLEFVCLVCSVCWLFLLGCQYQCKRQTGKTRLRNDLWCVYGDVKPYSLTHSLVESLTINSTVFTKFFFRRVAFLLVPLLLLLVLLLEAVQQSVTEATKLLMTTHQLWINYTHTPRRALLIMFANGNLTSVFLQDWSSFCSR